MKFNNNYINLWNHLSSKRKKMFVFLMVLILISSFAEVFAIGSIIPFISILTSPEVVLKNIYLNKILLFFGISKGENINLFLTIIFIFAAIFAGSTRLLLLWTTTKISFATGSDLSIEIYRKTLYQPYLVHTSRNSSEVVTGILIKSKRMIGSVFLPIINIITAVVLALVIAVFLVLLDPGIISFIFLSLGIIYFFLALIVKKRLQLNGIIEAKQHSSVMKHLQDGLGGIRDILLNSNQNFYADIYKDSDKKLRNASAITTFTAQSPKYFFETIGMVLIASIAYIFSLEKGGITNSLPILGAIAVGAQRILPMMQQAYQSWANLKSSSKILSDVLELLDQPYPSYSILPKPNQLDFSDKIEFRKISFKYSNESSNILENISFIIKKGQRIGIIGETGSGKSTLVDILMALLIPSTGKILIDDLEINNSNQRNWQLNIANVPQSIFLSDCSIAENIAFGISKDEIDYNKVKIAAQKAQIAEYIESIPESYDSYVGERGIRLSGGQRQRIGIARALYKDAKVIVFDEATSALDNNTETAVMEAINSLRDNLTVIIIAHRISTLRECDFIIELRAGKISQIGTYNDLIIFLNEGKL